jgi:chromodomain-helicase-DNA-binding protein 1
MARRKDAKKGALALHYTANVEPQLVDADLDPKIFAECKEKMRPVKKALKQLEPADKALTEDQRDEHIKRILQKIGDRITECLNVLSPDDKKIWRNHLWTFVSKFTEFSPKRLYKMYRNQNPKNGEDNEKRSKHRSRSSHHSSKRRPSPPPPNHPYRSFTSEDEHASPHGPKRPKPSSDVPSKRLREENDHFRPSGGFDSNYHGPYPSGSQAARSSWGSSSAPNRNQPYVKGSSGSERPPTAYRSTKPYDRPPATHSPSGQPNYSQYHGASFNTSYPAAAPQYPPNASSGYRDNRSDWNNRRPENHVRQPPYEGSEDKKPVTHSHTTNSNPSRQMN